MIELKVEDYCQDCKEFEPEVDTYIGMTCGYEFCNHTISCKHKQRCSEIYFHIENTKNTKKKAGF